MPRWHGIRRRSRRAGRPPCPELHRVSVSMYRQLHNRAESPSPRRTARLRASGVAECSKVAPERSSWVSRIAARPSRNAGSRAGPPSNSAGDLEESHAGVAVELAEVGKTRRDPLNESPLPDSVGIDTAPGGQQLCSLSNQPRRVPSEERPVVLPHRHAEIVPGSERRPSGSTNLNDPPPASRVFHPWASPCTSTARDVSKTAAHLSHKADARSITARPQGRPRTAHVVAMY